MYRQTDRLRRSRFVAIQENRTCICDDDCLGLLSSSRVSDLKGDRCAAGRNFSQIVLQADDEGAAAAAAFFSTLAAKNLSQ
jgi:hypothetical protein